MSSSIGGTTWWKRLLEAVWIRVWPRVEPWVLRAGYDPQRYWRLRGRFFSIESYQRRYYWAHDWMLERLGAVEWETLLEAGCGFGKNLSLIRSRLPPSKRLYGLDFSQPLLKDAEKHLRGLDVTLLEGSVLSFPALPEVMDVILTFGLLMHIPPLD